MKEQASRPVEEMVATLRRPLRERLRETVETQGWLEPTSKVVQRVVGRLMRRAGPSVTDALHGTWLGHALHPALTDVPLGAWTATAALDTLELAAKQRRLRLAADASLAVGIAGAIPTAITGIADWHNVNGYSRRLGLIHGGLNTLGLLCNVASLVLRVRGKRGPATACFSVGFVSASVAAWLGGDLVYQQGIGVDHTAFQEWPKDFVAVMPEYDLAEGRPRRVMANGVPVLLFRKGPDVFAIAETCSHQGGPLAEGEVDDGVVTCPWHGSQYRLEDGTLVHGPSTFNQPRYEVRLRDGVIEVRRAAA